MQKNNKQKIEKFYFKRFLEAIKLTGSYEFLRAYKLTSPYNKAINTQDINDSDESETKDNPGIKISDKPDIRLSSNNRNIGIEVTSFYRTCGKEHYSEQKQVGIRKDIIKEAQLLYEKKNSEENSKKIEVSLGLNTITQENKFGKYKKKLAENISQLITKEILSNSETSGELPPSSFKHIPELNFVYINKTLYDDAKWKDMIAHNIEPITLKSLQEIIDGKEGKIDEYEKFDETWLLIVSNYMDMAMGRGMPDINSSDIKVLKFDRVFLYITAFEEICEFTKLGKAGLACTNFENLNSATATKL